MLNETFSVIFKHRACQNIYSKNGGSMVRKVMSLKWLKQLLKSWEEAENNSIMEPRVFAVNLSHFYSSSSFLPPFFMSLGSRVTFCWQDKNAKFSPFSQLPTCFTWKKYSTRCKKLDGKDNTITISNRLHFGVKIVTFLWH
mgnify:CR=1 FL=1